MTGRVALITGGAGRIGRSLAAALMEVGGSVVLADVDGDALDETVPELDVDGATVSSQVVDMRDDAGVAALPELVVNRHGSLDVVVNCAALVGTSDLKGWTVPLEEQSIEMWRRAMDVNLTSIFVLAQAAAPHLAGSVNGNIINVSSIYGTVAPDPSLYDGTQLRTPAAYSATKGGLVALTSWLATELAPKVRANVITPGGIFRNQDPTFVERYRARTPLGRMGTEEDLKGAVVYLASDLAGYVTGHNLVVDGGWTIW